MRALLKILAACSVLIVAGCGDAPTPTAPSAEPLAGRTSVEVTAPWARAVEGRTGPGSLYAIYVPQNWNGDVVYFMHGILPPQAPVALPRERTGTASSSCATSSARWASPSRTRRYSENGLALKDAAQRTHQLRGLVASVLNGQPERSFIVALSLGTAPALQLIEQYPQTIRRCAAGVRHGGRHAAWSCSSSGTSARSSTSTIRACCQATPPTCRKATYRPRPGRRARACRRSRRIRWGCSPSPARRRRRSRSCLAT